MSHGFFTHSTKLEHLIPSPLNILSSELALHVLEIMTGFRKASENGGVYELESTCDKPAALPLRLMEGFLD